MKSNNLIESISYAFEGIIHSIFNERNLRIHIAIANLICAFAIFYRLDRSGWAVLLLTIIMVISAELFNTAIEAAVDTATDSFSVHARIAKDAAAGAVLITAIGAVIIGFILFGDIPRIVLALRIMTGNLVNICLLVLLLIADAIIVFKAKN